MTIKSVQGVTFKKEISFDTVALIIAACSFLIYFGGFKHTVEEDHMKINSVSEQVSQLTADVAGVKSDLAVLSAVVVDRTGKPLK
jgi:outer membrane murein-binding lipoprotein Lpp